MSKKHVAVLMGGFSSERPVSLASGKECADALERAGYDVTRVDVDRDIANTLRDLKPDVVFNALHGPFGEDGTIQGILEFLAIPYTHSGVLASALAMDKQRSKEVFRAAGLPVVESLIVSAATVRGSHVMDPPYVVKPNNEGSSVGVYLVEIENNGPPQLDDAMPAEVMVDYSGTAGDLEIAKDQFFWVLVLALLISYLLMSALFEDFLAPIVVLVTLPLAAAGGASEPSAPSSPD